MHKQKRVKHFFFLLANLKGTVVTAVQCHEIGIVTLLANAEADNSVTAAL